MSVKVVERKYLLPFILITSLFALWGFANDITNPMVAAFQTVMEISVSRASMVQFAFYGGYATMAIPAALFVQRYSYKKGILLGLGLYAVGALLFIPAAHFEVFNYFLVALYILTFGLAFLETTSNPFILSMGAPETSTRRLNLAQSFNPIGSIFGMVIASEVVLAALKSDERNEAKELIFPTLDEAAKATIRTGDLEIIRNPYAILGLVVVAMFIVIALVKMPNTGHSNSIHPMQSFRNLFQNKIFREGVVAQMFYIAAQIMCWTYIIQYADNLGIDKSTAQKYNILAMALFLCGRFIATALMKYVNSRKLLMIFAIGGLVTISGAIFIVGQMGLFCLVATSVFMSLMFPTIYGIALENVTQKDATLGAALLVMAIVGGAIMPKVQAIIIDMGTVGSLPAVNASYGITFVCFVVVALFGYRSYRDTLVKD